MNDNVRELLLLDENYLRSEIVRLFSTKDIQMAVKLMDDKTKIYCLEKELKRREEKEVEREEEEANKCALPFSSKEWWDFKTAWEDACKTLKSRKQ